MSRDENLTTGGREVRERERAGSEAVLTTRARTIWTSGGFLPIARSFAPGARAFAERLALREGERVLDVACGTGNRAIPAAEAGAWVSGGDIAPNLVSVARHEARLAGCNVSFEVGDAEALQHPGGAFETTVTMFGAMFAFRPERAARSHAPVGRGISPFPSDRRQ